MIRNLKYMLIRFGDSEGKCEEIVKNLCQMKNRLSIKCTSFNDIYYKLRCFLRQDLQRELGSLKEQLQQQWYLYPVGMAHLLCIL